MTLLPSFASANVGRLRSHVPFFFSFPIQAYIKLSKTIIENVETVAESSKNPDVVMFENFQHFYGRMRVLRRCGDWGWG